MFPVLIRRHLVSNVPELANVVLLRWNTFRKRLDCISHSVPSLPTLVHQVILACTLEPSNPVVAPFFAVVLDVHGSLKPGCDELLKEYDELFFKEFSRIRRVEDDMCEEDVEANLLVPD